MKLEWLHSRPKHPLMRNGFTRPIQRAGWYWKNSSKSWVGASYLPYRHEKCMKELGKSAFTSIHPSHKGQGIGDLLLKELIRVSEEEGFWTLQAGLFPENQASLHLHLKNGFREVGCRERIGKLAGVWRDNILLERRSRVNGWD